jgi:hypothetical protein
MRNMATLTAVASVLAIGIATTHAAPLFPSEGVGSSDGLLQKVQRGGDQMGPGSQSPGARGGEGGGRSDGPGAIRGGDRGTGLRGGEPGMRGEGRMRDQGARPQQRGRADIDIDRGRRGDRADRRSRVDIDVDRGRRGFRSEGRARVDIDVDRDRRRRLGRRGVDVYVDRGYGYVPGCAWLRRRALDTGSGYWWRRYRACIGAL